MKLVHAFLFVYHLQGKTSYKYYLRMENSKDIEGEEHILDTIKGREIEQLLKSNPKTKTDVSCVPGCKLVTYSLFV